MLVGLPYQYHVDIRMFSVGSEVIYSRINRTEPQTEKQVHMVKVI